MPKQAFRKLFLYVNNRLEGNALMTIRSIIEALECGFSFKGGRVYYGAMDSLEPGDAQHLKAAEGWLELGNHIEANEELEQITPRLRAHPHVLEMRWKIYAKAKKWELAVEVARALSEMLPDNSWGFVHYAYSLHVLKRTKEAYAVLIPVVDKFSDEIIRYNLACYSCCLGNLTESLQWLEKAIDLAGKKDIRLRALEDPDLEPLWAQIGEI